MTLPPPQDPLPEAELDRRLVDSYTRMPQDDGAEWDQDLREPIAEEPW